MSSVSEVSHPTLPKGGKGLQLRRVWQHRPQRGQIGNSMKKKDTVLMPPQLTVAEAHAQLAEAEANAKTQQDALDIVYEAWQIEAEKMTPLRELVAVASKQLIRAHQRSGNQ